MAISADDFKRRYAELSDEGLLAINRDELTPLARDVYDGELAERDLAERRPDGEESASDGGPQGTAPAGDDAGGAENAADPFQELAVCSSVEEAVFYRNLLREAGIEARIPTLGQFSVNWAGVSSGVEVPLEVRESHLAEATEIMDASISDEDLAAQAEAAASPQEAEEEDTEPEEEDPESK
jgi:hypothetical protein